MPPRHLKLDNHPTFRFRFPPGTGVGHPIPISCQGHTLALGLRDEILTRQTIQTRHKRRANSIQKSLNRVYCLFKIPRIGKIDSKQRVAFQYQPPFRDRSHYQCWILQDKRIPVFFVLFSPQQVSAMPQASASASKKHSTNYNPPDSNNSRNHQNTKNKNER